MFVKSSYYKHCLATTFAYMCTRPKWSPAALYQGTHCLLDDADLAAVDNVYYYVYLSYDYMNAF